MIAKSRLSIIIGEKMGIDVDVEFDERDFEFDEIAHWLEQKMNECGKNCADECDVDCPHMMTWKWIRGLYFPNNKEEAKSRNFCRYRKIEIGQKEERDGRRKKG
jgi:hypothetical protein